MNATFDEKVFMIIIVRVLFIFQKIKQIFNGERSYTKIRAVKRRNSSKCKKYTNLHVEEGGLVDKHFSASIQPNFCVNLQNNCRKGQIHKSIDKLFIIGFREEKLSVLTCQQAMLSKT